MRVDAYTAGSILHVIKRGARGTAIVRNDSDRKHFVRSLFYLNDEYQDANWQKAIKHIPHLARPSHWPKQKRLVDIFAWTLMSNHFHLIVRALSEKAVGRFMQRIAGSMSARFNAKYQEHGSLFQGAYKGRIVEKDEDLRWLASYVMAKNTFELYPGGFQNAVKKFDKAWQWAIKYPFSSIGVYAENISSPIITIEDNTTFKIFEDAKEFKNNSRDMLIHFAEKNTVADYNSLTLE